MLIASGRFLLRCYVHTSASHHRHLPVLTSLCQEASHHFVSASCLKSGRTLLHFQPSCHCRPSSHFHFSNLNTPLCEAPRSWHRHLVNMVEFPSWRSEGVLRCYLCPPACVMSYPLPRLNGADLLLKRPLRRRWLPNQILFIDQTAMRGAPHSFCASQSVAHLAAPAQSEHAARQMSVSSRGSARRSFFLSFFTLVN